MSKKKLNRFSVEDRKYSDGYGVDKRREAPIDKRQEKRFERALRTKNIDILVDEDDLSEYDEFNNQWVVDQLNADI